MTIRPPRKSLIPESPGRALIVDDELAVLDFYGEVLTELGFQVDRVSDGDQGLERIRSNDYSLVISDVRMPKMSGCELLLQAEKVRPGIGARFIFTTGLLENLTAHEYMMVTENPCILKPATLSDIEKAIGRLFQK